jgi:hypothetical protein
MLLCFGFLTRCGIVVAHTVRRHDLPPAILLHPSIGEVVVTAGIFSQGRIYRRAEPGSRRQSISESWHVLQRTHTICRRNPSSRKGSEASVRRQYCLSQSRYRLRGPRQDQRCHPGLPEGTSSRSAIRRSPSQAEPSYIEDSRKEVESANGNVVRSTTK